MEHCKPAVIVFPLGAEGHAAPMMHLSCCLALSGCSVTYVAMGSSYASIKERGTWPPTDSCIHLEPVHPSPDISYDGEAMMTPGGWFAVIRTMSSSFEEIVQRLVNSSGLACIVTDFHLHWVVDMAQKYRVPSAVLFPGNATWNWLELQFHDYASRGVFSPVLEEDSIVDDNLIVSEQPLIRKCDIPDHFLKPDELFFQQTVERSKSMWKSVAWVLADSLQENEEQLVSAIKKELGRKYLNVGPLALLNELKGGWTSCVGLEKNNMACLEWLEQQERSSVLYISFGSNSELTLEQYEQIALGVEATGRGFLWVIRSDVKTESWDFYQSFLDRTQDRGMIVAWCPQRQVLANHAVAAFLTHCGWNSVQDAASKAQPMLCWPCRFDQFLNCKLVVDDWKTGKRVPKSATRTEIQDLIQTVMEGEDREVLKRNAVVLGEKMTRAAVQNGSSCTNLNMFIEEITKTSSLSRMEEVKLNF